MILDIKSINLKSLTLKILQHSIHIQKFEQYSKLSMRSIILIYFFNTYHRTSQEGVELELCFPPHHSDGTVLADNPACRCLEALLGQNTELLLEVWKQKEKMLFQSRTAIFFCVNDLKSFLKRKTIRSKESTLTPKKTALQDMIWWGIQSCWNHVCSEPL